jgi:hypothetical protein
MESFIDSPVKGLLSSTATAHWSCRHFYRAGALKNFRGTGAAHDFEPSSRICPAQSGFAAYVTALTCRIGKT